MPKRRRRQGAGTPATAHGPAASAGARASSNSAAGTTSDAKLAARSGRGVAEWFEILDAEAATRLSHAQIVALLVEVYEAPEWGAETVAVRYQRERGIRLPGEQDDGTFAVSASRSVAGGQVALLEGALEAVSGYAGGVPAHLHRQPERCEAVWELPRDERLELRVAPPRNSRCAVSLVHTGIRLPERVTGQREALERLLLRVTAA